MKKLAENDQQLWVAVLADRIASRAIDDPEWELRAIQARVWEINTRLGDRLAVPLSISRGDEIQGLVRTPAEAWDVIDAFDSTSWINSFRFTIGIGTLSTGPAASTWDMDGLCFRAARDAMQPARREKRWVAFEGFGAREDGILGGVVRSLQIIREGWTQRQREAYVKTRHAVLQAEAAEAMRLDPSTLSKMLKAARYKPYLEIEASLKTLMGMFWTARRKAI